MSVLADGHHVFAVDSYGAGKTPAWDRPEHLSLADEVALAEPVMDKAGEGIVLVGHSYGAAVALTAALANPSRVKAIVVYEPTLFSLVNQVHPLPNSADAIRSAVQTSSEAVSKGDFVLRRLCLLISGPVRALGIRRPSVPRRRSCWPFGMLRAGDSR